MKKICKKVLGATLIAVLLASFNMSLAVSQTDINNQKSQQQENNNKIKETEQKKEEVKEIKDETLKEVEQLNSQITDYQGQITSLDAEISDANAKIKEQETKLAQAENDYQEQVLMIVCEELDFSSSLVYTYSFCELTTSIYITFIAFSILWSVLIGHLFA